MPKTKWLTGRQLDRDGLIAAVRQTAAKLGRRRVGRGEFRRETGITRHAVERHFRSFGALAAAAGLASCREVQRIPDEVLLSELRRAFDKDGPTLTLTRAAQITGRAMTTLIDRWGRWSEIIVVFIAWIAKAEPGYRHLEALRRRAKLLPPAVPATRQPANPRRFGELLRFRSLEYAPTDESGVIYLFGIVSAELGFIVDGLSKAFPDAEGKRRAGSEWRRVRIEFELKSRNFREHGHDPGACDLIVCWEHNWPECPLEVLELRSEVARLPAAEEPLPSALPVTSCDPGRAAARSR